MKNLAMKLAAAGLAVSVTGPVLAQDTAIDPATLTCADFVALDADGQAAAIAALHAPSMSGESSSDISGSVEGSSDAPAVAGSTDAGATASTDMAAIDALMVDCEGKDDMLAADAIAAR